MISGWCLVAGVLWLVLVVFLEVVGSGNDLGAGDDDNDGNDDSDDDDVWKFRFVLELLLTIVVVLLVDHFSTEGEAAPSRCDESLTKAANTKQCERSKATKLNAIKMQCKEESKMSSKQRPTYR